MWHKIKSFLFHNTSTRQTVAKNTFWLTVSNFGGRLLRSLIIIYATRVLGPSSWGTFSYAISIISFLTMFTDIGMSAIVSREISKAGDAAEQKKIISTGFVLKLALVGVGFVLVNAVAPVISTLPGTRKIIFILSFVFVFDAIRDFGSTMVRAFEKMELEAQLFLFTNLAIVVAGFIFLSRSRTVESFSFSYVTGTAVGMIATLYVMREYFKKAFTRFSKSLVWPIFSRTWPFAVSSLLGIFLTNTDIVIIGWFKTAAEVGYYSAVVRIMQVLYLLPGILSLSIMPTFARLAGKDPERMQRILERSLAFLFLAAFPLAIGGFILAGQVIALAFGSVYLPAAPSFQVLLLTLLVDFPVSIFLTALFTFDQQKRSVVYSAIGAVLNVVFDLIFIPRFGIVGSAWATFLAQCTATFYLWLTVKEFQKFHVTAHLKRIFMATAGMGILTVALFLSRVPVIPNIILSSLAYFGVLYGSREPVLREIKKIFSAAESAA